MKFCLVFHWTTGWGGVLCRRPRGHAGDHSVHHDPGTAETEWSKHLEGCNDACNGRCRVKENVND